MDDNDFRTFSEYMKSGNNSITASMEDYLEMICRLSSETNFTRIHDLAKALNVHPPSVTRMVQRLGKLNLIQYEKYGVIILKDDGRKLGEYLLNRHRVVETFLKLLGVSEENILYETEKIEHTISKETTLCFSKYISFINDNQDVADRFNIYKETK